MVSSHRRNLVSLGAVGLAAASPLLAGPLVAAPLESGQGTVDPIDRLLDRAGYGARWGDREAVAEMGYELYLEQQLDHLGIDDPVADEFLARQRLYDLSITALRRRSFEQVLFTVLRATIGRAVLSRRQLYEAMVEFWGDHFHIYLAATRQSPALKLVDDRDAIRPNALGTFRELLHASARSPAMLFYLDNVYNQVYGPDDKPNENYARELLELHTLGVEAGYDQTDVREAARILTGWGAYFAGREAGSFRFDPDAHDYGEKVFLGHVFPAGRGEEEVEEFLDLLVDQPATARFIATKLVRRFVADDPPAGLVDRVAAAYGADGDIKAMLREVFLSDDFRIAPESLKLKRPFSYAIAALRGLDADLGLQWDDYAVVWLQLMGQLPFLWPAPDGYPDVADAWSSNLLPRWNFALALTLGYTGGLKVRWQSVWEHSGETGAQGRLAWMAEQLFGQALDAERLVALTAFVEQGASAAERNLRLKEAVAIMLSSPDFQWA